MEIVDYLTDRERRRIFNRIKIIKLLKQGLNIRKVAEQLGVSTTTVVQVGKNFKAVANPSDERKKKKESVKAKYFFG